MGTPGQLKDTTKGQLFFTPSPAATQVNPVEAVTLVDTDGTPLLGGVAGGVGVYPVPGTYGYRAGTGSATIVVPAGGKVIGLTFLAPSGGAATLTINGGDTVTAPAGAQAGSGVEGQLIAPTLVFTGTASFWVEWAA